MLVVTGRQRLGSGTEPNCLPERRQEDMRLHYSGVYTNMILPTSRIVGVVDFFEIVGWLWTVG